MTGKELKEKRKSVGWTQQELAQRLGVSKGTIINYEKGKTIPESKTEILASVFGVESIREYKQHNLLNLLNADLRANAKKMPNAPLYVLQLLLEHIHPSEVIDYIDKHRSEYFDLEEFRLLAKNVVGLNEIEILQGEIRKINNRLDKLTNS